MTLTELIQNNPRIAIIVIAFLATLFVTGVRYFMIDHTRMKELRQRQKDLKDEIKKHRDNPEKTLELNKKMLEDIPEQLRHSIKPMMITLIPLLLLFAWLRSMFALTAIASTWLWWYIGASIILSILLNKALGMQ